MKQKLLIPLFCLFIFFDLQAQTAKKTLTPPSLKSFWGGYSEGNHPVSTVKSLVDSTLFVMDDKRNIYQVIRFRCVYKSLGTVEDPETGQVKTVNDLTSKEFFNTSRLTEIWRTYLKDLLKPGEEIWFVDIVVADKNRVKFYAPDIKVKLY